jgi:DNA-binding NtrC family response regulator
MKNKSTPKNPVQIVFPLKEAKKHYILKVLRFFNGNLGKAKKALKINPCSLTQKLTS